MNGNGRRTPGWYADPGDGGSLRWWDGSAWSGHTQPVQGAVIVDQTAAKMPTVVPESAANPELSVRGAVTPNDGPGVDVQPPDRASLTPSLPPQPPNVQDSGPPGRPKRRAPRVGALLLLIAFGVAGVWFWWTKSQEASSQSATNSSNVPGIVADAGQAPAADPPVPQACNDVVGALTADGTSGLVSTQLQSAATGGELSEVASFFAAIGPVTNDVMANSGAACVAAVDAAQGPTPYADFVNTFGSAMSVGTSTVNVGLSQPGGLTAPQKAELSKLATELSAVTARVAQGAPSALR